MKFRRRGHRYRACDKDDHKWVRDGDSLMYVKCLGCGISAVYTGRLEGLANYPINGGGV